MATENANPRRSKPRQQRIFVITFGIGSLLALLAFAWTFGPAYLAYWNYSPQEGDILFQSLPRSRLVVAIEGVSESPYSHCGIVARDDGRWVVYEAYGGVESTPLAEFVFRGRNQGFAAYRLKSEYQQFIPATMDHVRSFLGRPYDVRYRMDDDAIYCSELIYKAYESSSGQQLGELVRLGDLKWQAYEETIRYFERGPVPHDREMITPRHMAMAEQLELITAHSIIAY